MSLFKGRNGLSSWGDWMVKKESFRGESIVRTSERSERVLEANEEQRHAELGYLENSLANFHMWWGKEVMNFAGACLRRILPSILLNFN